MNRTISAFISCIALGLVLLTLIGTFMPVMYVNTYVDYMGIETTMYPKEINAIPKSMLPEVIEVSPWMLIKNIRYIPAFLLDFLFLDIFDHIAPNILDFGMIEEHDFQQFAGIWYVGAGAFDRLFHMSEYMVENEITFQYVFTTCSLFALNIFLILNVFYLVVIAPIMMMIVFIMLLIALIKLRKKPNLWNDVFVSARFSQVWLLEFALIMPIAISSVLFGIMPGSGAYVILAGIVLTLLLQILMSIFYYEHLRSDRLWSGLKQGMTVVSIGLVCLILYKYGEIGFIKIFNENWEAFARILSNHQGVIDTVLSQYNGLIVFAVIFGIVVMVLIAGLVGRLGLFPMKEKNNERTQYRGQIFFAVVLLVLTIIPLFKIVDTQDEQVDRFKLGQFALVNKDFFENYDRYIWSEQHMQEEIDLYKSVYEGKTDPEEKKEYKHYIQQCEVELYHIKQYIRSSEADAKANMILCIICAVILLGLEIAFGFIPRTQLELNGELGRFKELVGKPKKKNSTASHEQEPKE